MATIGVVAADEITAADFAGGVGFEHAGRTITEADVIGFAGLTGDWNRQHVNAEWARRHSLFGERIAHGLLVSSIAVGMIPERLRRALGTIRSANAVYKRPVLFGDTIRVAGRPLLGEASRNGDGPGDGRGVELRVLNQRDELISKMRLFFGERTLEAAGPGPRDELADAVELSMAELLEGRPYRTPGRTLTEAHLVGFSSTTADWSPPNADAAWAARSPVGARIAQDMLLIAVAAPMVPLDVARLIAARKAEITWHHPARVGDTMYVEGRFARSTPAAEGAVQEVYEFVTVNQRDEPMASMSLVLVMRDPAAG